MLGILVAVFVGCACIAMLGLGAVGIGMFLDGLGERRRNRWR